MRPTVELSNFTAYLNDYKVRYSDFEASNFREFMKSKRMGYYQHFVRVLADEGVIVKISHGIYRWVNPEPVHLSKVERMIELCRQRISESVPTRKSERNLDIYGMIERLEALGYDVVAPAERPDEHKLIVALKALGYRIFETREI
jgi:hypothetical protein